MVGNLDHIGYFLDQLHQLDLCHRESSKVIDIQNSILIVKKGNYSENEVEGTLCSVTLLLKRY